MLPRTPAAIALAALLSVAAACANATSSHSKPVPGTQVNLFAPTSVLASATVPALTPEQQYQILLGSNSIRPLSLTLPAGGYVRLEIVDTGADCKFSVGGYVQGLSVTNGTGAEVAFTVTPSVRSSPAPTATAAVSQPSATAGPPTATSRNSPPAEGAVPRTAASATSLPAATGGNAAPNPALIGCDGENIRSAALLVGATPAGQGETRSSPLPATAVASVMQVGVLLQPNGVQPARLQLPLNTTVHVVISNRGPACRFALGPFLQSIAVPANGSADFTFTGKSSSMSTPVPSSSLTAGCLGDAARQLQLLLPSSRPGG